MPTAASACSIGTSASALSFHKSVGERAAIVFAGPLVNVAFGGAILALLIFAKGLNVAVADHRQRRALGSPAAVAGLQAGDQILAVDGQPAIGMDAILGAIARDPDRLLSLEVRRSDRRRGDADMLHPTRPAVGGAGHANSASASRSSSEHIAVEPATAIVESARLTGQFVASNVAAIGEIITGERQLRRTRRPGSGSPR